MDVEWVPPILWLWDHRAPTGTKEPTDRKSVVCHAIRGTSIKSSEIDLPSPGIMG